MKEKTPPQTLSKVNAFKFICINRRYIQYYLYILHMPPIYVWSKIVFGLKILILFSFCFSLSQIMKHGSKTNKNTK